MKKKEILMLFSANNKHFGLFYSLEKSCMTTGVMIGNKKSFLLEGEGSDLHFINKINIRESFGGFEKSDDYEK